ncbi:MAG: hypothetical protein Q4G09_04570, partial [Clostridia bacterium]|nr:hypothetical protein [Clostridia bacterium]
ADKVRMLTLPEINKERGQTEAQDIETAGIITTEPADGLFILNKLPDAGLTGFTYSGNGYYWLASPYSSDASTVYDVYYNGIVSCDASLTYGARPIVSLRL